MWDALPPFTRGVRVGRIFGAIRLVLAPLAQLTLLDGFLGGGAILYAGLRASVV
jgi:hypothetical protein